MSVSESEKTTTQKQRTTIETQWRCERKTNNKSDENIKLINLRALSQKLNFFHTLKHITSVVERTNVIDVYILHRLPLQPM